MMKKSLYQKHRPTKFSNFIGLKKIVQTLKNSLAGDQVGHAYLFSGPRGTGKTTLARILAKIVNCQAKDASKTLDPCLKCDFCLAAEKGQAIDIIEIDAASNRGIDEIRDLRDKIKFAPTSAKYKVYIIDEVHMLTKEAFNALLKTLEEPPVHVIFILATTEAYKLPATILSRVQRFDFGRIAMADIIQNLKQIIKAEKFDIDDEAVALIAKKADGSHRDAISLLEQIKSYADKISVKEVEEILGITDREEVLSLLLGLYEGNRRAVLTQVENAMTAGFDLSQLALSLAETLRQLLYVKAEASDLTTLTPEETKTLKPLTGLSIGQLAGAAELTLKAVKEIKTSQIASLPLELALSGIIDLWAGDIEPITVGRNPIAVSEKPEQVVIESPESQVPSPKIQKEVEIEPVKEPEKKPEPADREAEKTEFFEPQETISPEIWKKVLDEAKKHNHSLSALLRDIKPVRIEGHNLILAAKFKFHLDKVSESKNRILIEEIIEQITGSKLSIVCRIAESGLVDKSASSDLLKDAEDVFN